MALDPITAGIGLVGKFVDKFVPDKDLATKLKANAASQEFSGELSLLVGQLEINKVEAAHKSLFVAGWRPFIGWVCGVGLLYNVLIQPIFDIWVDMPEINPDLLYPVLLGMLGMSGLRTYEKFKGVQRED
jgi:hypothetical protein|tara:strand:+ start:7269 stop:7658 length:390 start_codon:yes stop_codon:yes gene_type:complete